MLFKRGDFSRKYKTLQQTMGSKFDTTTRESERNL